MGKMMNALLLVFVIELALFLFTSSDASSTSLFDFLMGMSEWDASTLLSLVFRDVALLGVIGIAIGSFVTKNDWIWRAGMIAATFFTFGSVISQLWIFFNAHLPISNVTLQNYVAGILVAPLMLYFIFASIDFISGKD